MNNKVILSLASLSLLCSSCSLKGKSYPLEAYIHNLEYRDGFKIAQLTDLHFSSYDNLDEDFLYLDLMYQEQPDLDLVVITGDLFTYASKNTVRAVIDYFDSKKIPWTITYGNHDEQIYADYTFLSRYVSEAKYSQFSYLDDDLNGLSNNVINLKKDNETKFQLYFIDSNTYTYKNGIGYDAVHDDQIEFYKAQVELANRNRFGSTWKKGDKAIKSLLFQHIPLPEIKDAVDGYEIKQPINGGEYRENSCPPKFNTGFFNEIKEYESTMAVVTGHDHINNFIVSYQGIDFVYGTKSTDNMYLNEDMLGYRLLTIDSEDSYSTRCYFHTYSEVK